MELVAAFWEGRDEIVVSVRGGIRSQEGCAFRVWEEPASEAFQIESQEVLPVDRAQRYFHHLMDLTLVRLRGAFAQGWSHWLDKRLWIEGFDCHAFLTPQIIPVIKRGVLDDPDLYVDESLWPLYSPQKTRFRIWAPTASEVRLHLYPDYDSMEPSQRMTMERKPRGLWETTCEGDLHGVSYTFCVEAEGRMRETIDPHSLSLTLNSKRSVVVDMQLTHPKRWEEDRWITGFKGPTDAIIYEAHIRDQTMHPSSGVFHKGKYRGLTETDTVNTFQQPTALGHLVDLGITHLHLLPVQDFGSVDEQDAGAYNWGYDPECYSAPEGQYATDPRDPVKRVREMKGMVRSLHESGIAVVMDVVYNHTYRVGDSTFDSIVPRYFYRLNPDGTYSNGSGCGNEIATERPMVRRYIVDSLRYWLEEYHVDGFRLDLLALIDRDTVRQIEQTILGVHPEALLYGEPWGAGLSQLDPSRMFYKGIQREMRVAVFNDHYRDAMKGRPDDGSLGFASGDLYQTTRILKGLVGSVSFEETDEDFAAHPSETVNYNSCHDNLTLHDKLVKSLPHASAEEIIQRNKLVAFLTLLAQGIPFLHAGEELARSKRGHHNSYNAGDVINQINWEDKALYFELFSYYRNLIRIRKNHPLFRLGTAQEVLRRIDLLDLLEGSILLQIDGQGIDSWSRVLIAINGHNESQLFSIPSGKWRVVVNGLHAGDDTLGIADQEVLMVNPVSGVLAVWDEQD